MALNTGSDSGLVFWRLPAGHRTIEGYFSSALPVLWVSRLLHATPLKLDGLACLKRGLRQKPIDLAAIQGQSLELGAEALKAGGFYIEALWL